MKKMAWLAALVLAVWAGGALAQDDFSWEGYALTVALMDVQPYDADFNEVLASLQTADGAPVAKSKVEICGMDIALTDSAGQVYRPYTSEALPYGMMLIYRVPVGAGEDGFSLGVSPVGGGSAQPIEWRGKALTLTALLSDRALIAPFEIWRTDGYLAMARLQTADGSPIPWEDLAYHSLDLALKGPGGESYRAIRRAPIAEDTDTFVLIYHVGGETPAQLGSLTLEVSPFPAMWVAPGYRNMSQAFYDFVPSDPQPGAIALAMSESSAFKPGLGRAMDDRAGAYEALGEKLVEIQDDLSAALSGSALYVVDDPDKASIFIVLSADYTLAGKYGYSGEVSAYNCKLALYAQDAASHEQIAKMEQTASFGKSISVSYGTTKTWKWPPMPSTFEQLDEFIGQLAQHTGTR